MNRYPDEMSLQEARRLFFKHGNLGEDGGYSRRWVRVESKPFPFYFLNSRSRVAAARLHDLHHIAAEYETDWPGEAEISAWEIASGCAHYHAAWILDLGGMQAGIVVAPQRLFRALLRGRRATTNLYKKGFDESRLNEITVGTLRNELGLNAPMPTARATDIGLFVFWCGFRCSFGRSCRFSLLSSLGWWLAEQFAASERAPFEWPRDRVGRPIRGRQLHHVRELDANSRSINLSLDSKEHPPHSPKTPTVGRRSQQNQTGSD